MNTFVKIYYFIKSTVGLLILKIISPLEKFTQPIFWLEQIPNNLRPDDRKCKKLEMLRRKYSIPNNTFLQIVVTSPAITRKVQENAYFNAKEQMPQASEKEILEAVFRSRVFPQNPCGLKMTEQEIQKAMQNVNSLDDLKEYFVEVDKKETRFRRDPVSIGKVIAQKVDEILEN